MIDVRPFEWLPERITRAENTARARKVRFSFKTEEGATESDLLTLEAKIGMPLPKSYRHFLLMSRFAILEWESPKSGGIIKTVRLEDMLETLTELRKDADEAYANGFCRRAGGNFSRW